jgi:hypothetical protein
LLAFAWLVLRARAVTGDWPAPIQPDPKAIGGITAIVVSGTLPLDDRKHEGPVAGLTVRGLSDAGHELQADRAHIEPRDRRRRTRLLIGRRVRCKLRLPRRAIIRVPDDDDTSGSPVTQCAIKRR